MKNFIVSLFVILSIVSCTNPSKEAQDKITALEKEVYVDSTFSFDKDKCNSLIRMYTDYANKFTEDTISPAYLFKAGQLAISLNNGNQAQLCFGTLASKFPEYKAPVVLFMKAYIYENLLGNKDEAKKAYNEFIQKYPEHELVKDAKATLEIIDLTPEQLIEHFEKGAAADSSVTASN